MRGGQIFLSVDILDKNFLLSISVKRTFLVYLARDWMDGGRKNARF